MRFLDANIILRYLTRDDEEKAARCFDLFQRVKRGEEALTTCEAVIAEVVYVLASPSLYHLPRDEIRTLLMPIIKLPGLKLRHKEVYIRAMDLFVSHNVDFDDALMVAHMERKRVGEVLSYDRDLGSFSGIHRLEP